MKAFLALKIHQIINHLRKSVSLCAPRILRYFDNLKELCHFFKFLERKTIRKQTKLHNINHGWISPQVHLIFTNLLCEVCPTITFFRTYFPPWALTSFRENKTFLINSTIATMMTQHSIRIFFKISISLSHHFVWFCEKMKMMALGKMNLFIKTTIFTPISLSNQYVFTLGIIFWIFFVINKINENWNLPRA